VFGCDIAALSLLVFGFIYLIVLRLLFLVFCCYLMVWFGGCLVFYCVCVVVCVCWVFVLLVLLVVSLIVYCWLDCCSFAVIGLLWFALVRFGLMIVYFVVCG